MSKSFDNNIKESLENFEMPYDANAWAQFEKQLPPSNGAAPSSQLGWKIAAIFAVVATVATSVWYLNSDDATKQDDSVAVEQVETTQVEIVTEENASEQTEHAVVAEQSEKVAHSENPRVVVAQKVIETAPESKAETKIVDSETAAKADVSGTQIAEKKPNLPAEKPTVAKEAAKPLVARFTPSTLNICVGEEVSFINESSDLKAKMAWDFGDGTLSNVLNPSHGFVNAGNYSVTLKAENNSKVADRTVNITVNPSPTANIEASQKLPGYDAIPFYHFETVLQPNETAVWSFSDGSVVNGESAEHLYRNAGKSVATLTVRNNLGCTTSDNWEIEYRKPFDLLAPNTFTPDGNQVNEAFMPEALADMGVAFDMVIRDLKGQEVYRTSNPSEPWNGKLHNSGAKLDAGTYAWTVVLKEEIIGKKDFSGTIKLLR